MAERDGDGENDMHHWITTGFDRRLELIPTGVTVMPCQQQAASVMRKSDVEYRRECGRAWVTI